jgi:uroporphyrinogen-III decarboxylase
MTTMTRRERLMATLRGQAVDRPAVCFYELNGLDENPSDPDPFNIYTDPSWLALIELTRECTDRIVMRHVHVRDAPPDPLTPLTTHNEYERDGSRYRTTTVKANGRTLTSRVRRDPDVNTDWVEEHLLKDADDLRAYLDLPAPVWGGEPDTEGVRAAERALGDTGIVMIDTGDPLNSAAALFDMATYTIIAMTEPELFTRLLDRFASVLLPYTDAVARALPGRLWRIYGPEYAAPPYLPPSFYDEYVVRHVSRMVASIQKHGGYARIHSHGNLRDVLDKIMSTGCDGLDPIEPPPQGDMSLADVRAMAGEQLVLFGNLEITDIENMETKEFNTRITTALREGTTGSGRGFVLMPSACPYGRSLSPLALANYRAMVDSVHRWGG